MHGGDLMTEAEWQTCDAVWPMLDYLAGKASERKLRLLACLCCRRIWDVIPTDESRRCKLRWRRANHCRATGVNHVRGCGVIDAVLQKE
jgi:hypothetical protein